MYETPEETAALQALIDRSLAGATGHLRSIVHGDRVLSAEDLVGLLTGMKVLSAATVTARGEPRVSALDGHFLHATWTFSTDGSSAKARHLERQPAISVAHVDHEDLGVFMHGRAVPLTPDDPTYDGTWDHWTRHYGSDPRTWGDDIRMYRLEPHFAVGYAADRERLLAQRL